jgi:L-serine dehydratase
MYYPSIFNDVIGPVMRGPSSSHCAAALRIGRIARNLMTDQIDEVVIEFTPTGSLATTHASQGSDMGLFGGLLGWDATDERLGNSAQVIRDAGIKIDIRIVDYEAQHPNTYRLNLRNKEQSHTLTAISTGGGMIEVIEVDGCTVSMAGDYYETFVYLEAGGEDAVHALAQGLQADKIILLHSPSGPIVEVKAQQFSTDGILKELLARWTVRHVKHISPVLPVLSRRDMLVPFITCAEMLEYNRDRGLSLWELAVDYECARGGLLREQAVDKMIEIVEILERSIQQGVQGTVYADRILGHQSGQFKAQMQSGRLLEGGMLNQMILYVTALMEVKSSMGVIVAAPTAGACAGLPGATIAAARAMGLSVKETAHAMLAAGVIGMFIAAHATFAAEVGGCQAETGSGAGMAAAALVTLGHGTAQQAVNAASMALQNVLGMICDPVGNRVEVPCLGKNVMAASNALACANMALANFDAVVPLDEVIETMDRVGKSIPVELRCTALGGLSITKTALEIEQRLQKSGKQE